MVKQPAAAAQYYTPYLSFIVIRTCCARPVQLSDIAGRRRMLAAIFENPAAVANRMIKVYATLRTGSYRDPTNNKSGLVR